MTSMKELRERVPMPSHCPICGIMLTKENAELDHILPPRLGGKMELDNLRYVCRSCNVKKADRYDHLYEYYYRLMINKGISGDNLDKKVDFALNPLSEEELITLEKKVDSKDAAYKRILAYYNAIKDHLKIAESEVKPTNDELAESMIKTMNAYDKYDYSSEMKEKINGNTFVFEKTFPINQYRNILAEYGENEQGETYSVYIDEDGRLVVY